MLIYGKQAIIGTSMRQTSTSATKEIAFLSFFLKCNAVFCLFVLFCFVFLENYI